MVIYHPYPQLKIHWHPGHQGFTLTLPWVELEIEVEDQDFPWIQDAIENLHQTPENPNVQKFIEALSEHHIAYPAPRLKEYLKDEFETYPNEKKQVSSLISPQDFMSWTSPHLELSPDYIRNFTWQWDVAEITQVTQVHSTSLYDPLSVVSYVWGKVLTADAQGGIFREKLTHLLNALRERDEPTFFNFMKDLLRQTHYITRKFQEYCPLGLTIFKKAHDEIKNFIQEEKGHDKLMSASLKILGYDDPKEIAVYPETIFLMEAFKKSAELCPMTFTAMVGFFEGGVYGASDPLADVLKQSSKPQAAHGYDRHFQINNASNHNQVVYTLATKLPLQTYDQVVFLTRFMELIAHIGKTSDQRYANQLQKLLNS